MQYEQRGLEAMWVDCFNIEAIENVALQARDRIAVLFPGEQVDAILFGSYARGAATPYSDIDLCVDAAALRGLFALAGLRADLEEALNKELDLITVNSLKYNKDMGFLENLRKDQVLIYEMAS